MKKLTLLSSLLFIAMLASAQWTEVQIGNSNSPISCLFADNTSLVVGTAGDGLFRTLDNGSNFTDISGNIGNKIINCLAGTTPILLVGTQNGAFLTVDLANYMDCTSTGLSSTDVTFYGLGSKQAGGNFYIIGTNGGGIFTSANPSGPWSDGNSGITGNGLFINSLNGYHDPANVSYAILATNGGVYFSYDDCATWTQKNNGLTGDALVVTEAYALGAIALIATHAGMYYSQDFGDTWTTLIPDLKINKMLVTTGVSNPVFFIFGESNLYSMDLQNWQTIALDGYAGGEITEAAVNADFVFVAGANQGRDANAGGVLYKAPYNTIVGIDEHKGMLHAELSQNEPNPFSKETIIHYNLKADGMVAIGVFDLQGRKVKNLINRFQLKGEHNTTFDAGNLPEGIYYYKLSVGNEVVATKKMVVVK
ncbi:MAG: T9SS type A sorting domain-containing protein [Bacteroidota bacterium]